jgi:hypothetical protein
VSPFGEDSGTIGVQGEIPGNAIQVNFQPGGRNPPFLCNRDLKTPFDSE